MVIVSYISPPSLQLGYKCFSKLYITFQFTARIQVIFSHAINLKKTALFSTIIGLKVKIKIVSLNRLKCLVTFSVILKI